MEQVGTEAATLLLRLCAELGAAEAPDEADKPELLGACCSAVLAIEGPSAIPWAARYLQPGDEIAGEAALAIAATHAGEAFAVLRTQHGLAARSPDAWFANTLLQAIALTRQPEAIAWLLDHVARDTQHATAAHQALCNARPLAATKASLSDLGSPC